ncbi:phage tail tape measure protein [Methylocystis sp. ATCC 49242]|uniref:phage tail tape measure protein n=1 Tax=Methylocystis sp. ATCC 49242 TaxID=622637 RepID=UPI000564D48E|nr:phage tail tape measure protein [Methylocystis sp. ATCC 49242]
MASLTSSLTVRLIDDVSRPARTVAQALKDAEKAAAAVAKGMGKAGSDPFRRQLASLKLTGAELRDVRAEWLAYARAQKQAMGAQAWSSKGPAMMLAKEKQILAAAKASVRERIALNKAIAASATHGVGRFSGIGAKASDVASFALPGAAGMMVGMGGAAVAGAAVGGVSTVAIKEAISRNKAFAEIQKKVTLDAGDSWSTLDRKIANVSTSIGKSYQDVAAIFAQGGQSGVAYKDLDAFALLGAKVSTAWDISAREAAQMLTEVRAQTGKSIADLEVFADKINGLGDVSAAAEKDIGAMSQRAMAGMKAAGVGENDALAMMTALRGVGMETDVAARFLTAFTSKLRTASTLGKGAAAAFKEIGLSGKQVEEGMQTKPMETMIDLLERVGKAKNSVGTMKSLVGAEWWDEATRMQQALPEIIRLLDYLGGGTWRKSMQGAMDIETGTTEAKLEKLKQSLLDIAAQAAKPVVLPWLDSIADKWASAANRMRAATEESEKARSRATPVGESVVDLEKRLKINQPPAAPEPPRPVFQQLPQISVKAKDWAKSKDAGPMGVAGGISASNLPAFRKMQGIPITLDASALDAAKAQLELPGTKITAQPPRQPGGYTHGLRHAPVDKTGENSAAVAERPAPAEKPAPAAPTVRPLSLRAKDVERVPPAAPVITPQAILPPKPAPTLAPRMLREDAKARPIPAAQAPAAQEMVVTPKVEPVPPFTPQELRVTPKVEDIPPIPPQEMVVTPRVDVGPLDAFKGSIEGASDRFAALNTTVTPQVDASSAEAAKGAAEGARTAFEGLNLSVAPHVDTGSVDAGIGKVQTLLGLLHQVGAAASGATGKVNALSAAAGAASAKIGTIRAEQNRNFTASAQKGE